MAKYKVKGISKKAFITKLLREISDPSEIDKDTDPSITYDIIHNEMVVGSIKFSENPNKFDDTTVEILNLELNEGYQTINVAMRAVKSIFKESTEINRLVVSLPPESRLFWEKLGFNRLNDDYHVLFRGH